MIWYCGNRLCGVLLFFLFFFFVMIRRPPRSTQSRSSAASDVYKRQARKGHTLDVDDIPQHIRRDTAPEVSEIRIPTGVTMEQVERIVIQETMKVCGFNKEACAKMLGIGLRTLYRKLKQYDIR